MKVMSYVPSLLSVIFSRCVRPGPSIDTVKTSPPLTFMFPSWSTAKIFSRPCFPARNSCGPSTYARLAALSAGLTTAV